MDFHDRIVCGLVKSPAKHFCCHRLQKSNVDLPWGLYYFFFCRSCFVLNNCRFGDTLEYQIIPLSWTATSRLQYDTKFFSPSFLQTHRVSADGRGWVDILSVPFFASNGSAYISISPLRDGASGLFKHLVHVNISKKRVIPLTHGTYEVQKIVYWDESNGFVYVLLNI